MMRLTGGRVSNPLLAPTGKPTEECGSRRREENRLVAAVGRKPCGSGGPVSVFVQFAGGVGAAARAGPV